MTVSRFEDQVISTIAPLRNDGAVVEEFMRSIHAVLTASFDQFEVILVDDGSTDDTEQIVLKNIDAYPGMRYVRLPRHFGTEIALAAGLDRAIGDLCVILQAGFDPPALVPDFVRKCRDSGRIVLGQLREASKTASIFYRLGRRAFHFITSRLLALPLPRNTTYFMALDRRAIQQIGRTRDKKRYFKAIAVYIGLPHVTLPYDPIVGPDGRIPHLRTFWEAVDLSLEVIVMNSQRPLRIVTMGALFIGMMNFLYFLYVAAVYVFKDQVAEGWVTQSAHSSLSFVLLFAILAVIAEYIGRVLEETRSRPLYYIVAERSAKMHVANMQRKNVLTEPIEQPR
jgi:dolichol-phosphate mannosyltransferase